MSGRINIVAEIGQNHNGSLDLALKLIDAARTAGADMVKFQKREPRTCVPLDQWEKRRDTPWGEMSYIEYRERLELSVADYDVIDAYCVNIGMPWFVAPWDVASYHLMAGRYELPLWKVASACLTDTPLLIAMAKPGRKVVLSTGMSTPDEIRCAVATLALNGALITLCHCNSTYPCPPEDLNLRCIETLRREYGGASYIEGIGYSGHEVGLGTTIAAVALGVTYVERHITLNRAMWGTDQAASIEPQGFSQLVKHIRTVELALGDGVKRITAGEVEPRQRLRRVHAAIG
jgi:N-acetylneuraminate synthase